MQMQVQELLNKFPPQEQVLKRFTQGLGRSPNPRQLEFAQVYADTVGDLSLGPEEVVEALGMCIRTMREKYPWFGFYGQIYKGLANTFDNLKTLKKVRQIIKNRY
jgi:hypothetical protein